MYVREFHKNSDVDRLYVKRKDGGRGLKSFEDSFCTRIVGLAKHLERDRYRNHLLQNVFDHEQQRIIRLGKEYEKMYQPEQEEEKNSVCDKTLTKRISNETCKKKKEKWHEKAQHGYIFRKCNEDQNIDKNASNSWLTKGKLSSHVISYRRISMLYTGTGNRHKRITEITAKGSNQEKRHGKEM